MTSKQNKFKIEKRKLLAIPLIVCLCVSLCFGINFSKVFASGYVTDDLTVKIGYWGMDESTFVEKGTYNWYTLASSLPMHKVAYSFYQENKYGYNTIIDSAKGFYIGDFLDFAGIERSGINSISFYTKDVNVGYFTSFSYNELFSTTRYYFEDLSGNLRPTFEDMPSEEDPEQPDPSGGGDNPSGGGDNPSGGNDPSGGDNPSGGGDDSSGGGSDNPSGENDDPPGGEDPSGGDDPKNPPPQDPPTGEGEDDTGLLNKVRNGFAWDAAYAAERKYKLLSVSDTNAWRHKTVVQPMLALEDHWESYETTSNNQPFNTAPNYSSLSTGNRFRLLFGQSSPKESKTNQTAKYVHTLYVTYTGVPEVVDDMSKISGKTGKHRIRFNVSAGDTSMVQSLIDDMGWNSTNEEVLTIDSVKMTKNNKYSDVVTVEIEYSIKKKGKASIKGTYGGIEVGGSAISTSDNASDDQNSDNEGKDDGDSKTKGDGKNNSGESKSGDKAKGDSGKKAGKATQRKSDQKNSDKKSSDQKKTEQKDEPTKDNKQVYELDEDIARMLTQTSKEVVQNEEETLKVKDVENNTGPATAAGAIGLCFGGVIIQRIRFRKKL